MKHRQDQPILMIKASHPFSITDEKTKAANHWAEHGYNTASQAYRICHAQAGLSEMYLPENEIVRGYHIMTKR